MPRLPDATPLMQLVSPLMLCVLTVLGVYWGLQLAYPGGPIATQPEALPAPANRLAQAASLLSAQSASAPGQDQLASLDIRLIGTLAAGKGSRAVILAQGKAVTLSPGEEISPGVVIAKIGADHIEISAGPARSRIELAVPKKLPGKGASS